MIAKSKQALGNRYWPILVVAWIVTLVLGHWGFTIYFQQQGETKTFVDIAYLDLQLYKLSGGSVSGHVPWQLNVARIAAPAIAGAAILRVLFLFLGDRVREWRLRRLRGHVIVCGTGKVAFHIAVSAREAGHAVVLIDRSPGAGHFEKWKARGGLFIAGDPAESATLLSAAVPRARAIVAASDDDGANVTIALAARQALGGKTRDAPLTCHVQVMDYDLGALLRASAVLRDSADAIELRVMNAYDTAARIASQQHPLDRERIAPNDPRTPQLILLGFGRMGSALALQYAKVSHFANGKPIEISAFDRAAAAREKAFHARHPGLRESCRIRFHECAFDDVEAIEAVRTLAGRTDALTTVAVCLGGDSQSLAFALAVQNALRESRVPVLVRLSSKTGLAALVDRGAAGGRLAPFGTLEQVCDWNALDTEQLDRLAKEVHKLYQVKHTADSSGVEQAPAWHTLDPGLQDSCRQQADHIPVKLRTIGCTVQPGSGDSFAFTHDEIELLAHMEHRRWVAERRLDGWRAGPKDTARKTTPYLVDYDALDDAIKDYDRDAVRNIPRLIGMAGGHLNRNK